MLSSRSICNHPVIHCGHITSETSANLSTRTTRLALAPTRAVLSGTIGYKFHWPMAGKQRILVRHSHLPWSSGGESQVPGGGVLTFPTGLFLFSSGDVAVGQNLLRSAEYANICNTHERNGLPGNALSAHGLLGLQFGATVVFW